MAKHREYVATSLMQQYLADHKGMPEDFEERTEYFKKKGYEGTNLQESMITSSCFLGFRKTRQAYRFHKDLIEELKDGGPMEFYLSDLHLPFLDLYIDLESSGIIVDGHLVFGAFVSAVMDHGEPVICLTGVVKTGNNELKLLYASMDDLLHKTIQERIDRTTGDLRGNAAFTELLIRCLAYISSEKPDVQDRGTVVVKGDGNREKRLPTRIRAWDVGYRYMQEKRNQPPSELSSEISGTHVSPRPHMRRGHWHTYRVGPGRTERKVVWVSECAVGHGVQVSTVRTINNKQNYEAVGQ